MNTADKVQRMFYKAAAAKRLNSKIMQKRATAANRPSEAYLAGFCKVAEDAGVDPIELMKAAGWFGDAWNSLKNGVKSVGRGLVGSIGAIPGAIAGGITGMQQGNGGFYNGAKAGLKGGYEGAIGGVRNGINTVSNAASNFGSGFMQAPGGGRFGIFNKINRGVKNVMNPQTPTPQAALGPQPMPGPQAPQAPQAPQGPRI